MSSLATKRLFIAVALPDTVQAAMATLQHELQKSGADVKWVEPINFHITLKFLGDAEADKFPRILDALKDSLAQQKSLPIALDELGAFPSKNAPRIIWLGSREKTPLVSDAVAKIDAALSPLGFQKEDRPFFTHATLGRARSSQNRVALIEKINLLGTTVEPQTFVAASIDLMESRLDPKGPVYSLMGRIECCQV